MNVLEASGLGKRYRSTWALRECTLEIPAGRVTALVGPNGAGKTTLLNLAVGLTAPSAGEVTVLGGCPPGSPPALDGVAFVAQDTPVYKTLSVADMIYVTRSLNRRFDQPYARARLSELDIPLRRKAYWEVDLDAITFGDDTAEMDDTGVILDTGTSLIALPSTMAELL